MFLCKKDRKIVRQRNTEHSELPRRDTPHLLKLHRGVAQIIITMLQNRCQQINRFALRSLNLHGLYRTMKTPQTHKLLRRNTHIITKNPQELPLTQTSHGSHLCRLDIALRFIASGNHFSYPRIVEIFLDGNTPQEKSIHLRRNIFRRER